MAVDNQKLFSQMADLGRNINLLSDSVKKNTAVVESMSAGSDNEGDKKISDTLNSLDKTLKDIQKVLATPKPKETFQPAAEQKPSINQSETKQKEKSSCVTSLVSSLDSVWHSPSPDLSVTSSSSTTNNSTRKETHVLVQHPNQTTPRYPVGL